MSRGERKPPLYAARIWDLIDGRPTATEEIRRRTLASARANAVSRMHLPVPIMAELVEIATGEVVETLYNHASRAALGLPAPTKESPAP